MAAARLGMSTDSEEVPQTAQGGEPITAQTPSSVLEDIEKAVTGRMPLTSEKSVSQLEGSNLRRDRCPQRETLRSRIVQRGEGLRQAARTGCPRCSERTRRSSENVSMKGRQSHRQE